MEDTLFPPAVYSRAVSRTPVAAAAATTLLVLIAAGRKRHKTHKHAVGQTEEHVALLNMMLGC